MFGFTPSYKAFTVSGNPAAPETLRTGFRWLASSETPGETGLLFLPGKSQLDGNVIDTVLPKPVLKALRDGRAVDLGRPVVMATNKTLRTSRWRGGPVLALWTDDKALDELHVRPGVTAICAIEWAAGNIERWRKTMNPVDLATGSASPEVEPQIDLVVQSALRSLTTRVNLSTGLAHPSDYDAAIEAFEILRHAGYACAPDDVHVWAIRNGWRPDGAANLAEVARKVLSGARVSGAGRRSQSSQWATNILEMWRNEAGGQ